MSKAIKKVVTINNYRTSIQMNLKEWLALEDICKRENILRNQLIELIYNYKGQNCLTSTLRLFLIVYFQNMANKIKVIPHPQPNLKNILKTLNDIQ